jgi:hypothetical protein
MRMTMGAAKRLGKIPVRIFDEQLSEQQIVGGVGGEVTISIDASGLYGKKKRREQSHYRYVITLDPGEIIELAAKAGPPR